MRTFTSPVLARFASWYNTSGHWVYQTRQEAADVWIQRGIKGLPLAPSDAAEKLKAWIAADTAPALIARLRAEEAAAAASKPAPQMRAPLYHLNEGLQAICLGGLRLGDDPASYESITPIWPTARGGL